MKVRSLIDAVKRYALSHPTTLPSVDLGDLQVVAGFGALVYGVSLVSAPGAWMLAGALLLTGWAIPRIQFTRRVKE